MSVITPLAIPDAVVLTPEIHGDSRGYFFEVFRLKELAPYGVTQFVQENQSSSRQWTLRGLHYQLEQPQGKLLRVLSGRIFDVAVDMRPERSTYGQHVAVYLDAELGQSIWLPPGLAHGFLVVSEQAVIQYQCSDYYAPQHERSLLWSDPHLKIDWPLPEGQAPLLSGKDKAALTWKASQEQVNA